jgi:hypothetical protein
MKCELVPENEKISTRLHGQSEGLGPGRTECWTSYGDREKKRQPDLTDRVNVGAHLRDGSALSAAVVQR